MRRMYMLYSKIIILVLFSTILIVAAADANIVCNKFNVEAKVSGSTIDISLDTDLPDNTVIMVNVSRSYFQKGDSAKYSAYYYYEKSTVKKWKSNHKVSIVSDKWKSALRTKQEKMSRLGLGFDVASISDQITVGIVVSIDQTDPRFGKLNSKLSGKMLKTSGLRIVRDEITIEYPLDSPPEGKSPFPSLNPQDLDIGQLYIVSKRTSLMPSHSPSNPIKSLNKIKQIQKGGAFKVLETFKKRGNPWYRVVAFDQRKKKIGTGWINSTALLGQKLKTYK